MNRKPLQAVCAAVIICISSEFSVAFADVFDTFGAGTRGAGMGGAVGASTSNLDALYYNPAGLGKSYGNTFGLGYMYSYPFITTKGQGQGVPGADYLSMGMIFINFGVSLNEIIKKLPMQATLGVSFSVLHDFRLAVMDDFDPDSYQYLRYGSPIKRTTGYLGLGVEVVKKWLWLGIGGHVMVSGEGTMHFVVDASTLNTTDPIAPTSQTVSMDVKTNLQPTCGIIFSPYKDLNLAFSYKRGISALFKPFKAFLYIDTAGGDASVTAMTAIISFYSPDMFRYGISYKIAGLTMEFDACMEQWKSFREDAPRVFRTRTPRFSNIVSYHGGLEYEIGALQIRVGYQYAPSVIPKQNMSTNYLDTTRHIVSLGLGVRFRPPWELLYQPVSLALTVQDQILEKAKINTMTINGHDLTGIVSLEFKFGSTIPENPRVDDRFVKKAGKDAKTGTREGVSQEKEGEKKDKKVIINLNKTP
jgi:long-chain fatty acid transport protein